MFLTSSLRNLYALFFLLSFSFSTHTSELTVEFHTLPLNSQNNIKCLPWCRLPFVMCSRTLQYLFFPAPSFGPHIIRHVCISLSFTYSSLSDTLLHSLILLSLFAVLIRHLLRYTRLPPNFIHPLPLFYVFQIARITIIPSSLNSDAFPPTPLIFHVAIL